MNRQPAIAAARLDAVRDEAAAGHAPRAAADAGEPGPIALMLVISSLEHGGAERQVIELANTLDRRLFEVTVCSLSSHTPLAAGLRDPAQLVVVEKRGRFDWGLVRRVARLMKQRRAQVVHGFLFDAEMTARLAARMAGVPAVIASERNTDYHIPFLHRVGNVLTRGLFDVMVANSEAGKRFNVRARGIDPQRIVVVHNGVDSARFQPGDGGEIRAELGIEAGRPVIGMVATFKRQKRYEDFFRMARKVVDRFPAALFACVGEPMRDNQQGAEDYHREMHGLVDDLALWPHLRLLGNRGDMPRVNRLFDVCVLTSSREGTPNVLLEAMASGVPVVATAAADNARIVPDGRAGFIVPIGDVDALAERVCRLLADTEARRGMGRDARAWVEAEFSTAVLARRMGEIYSRTLAGKLAGRRAKND